MTDFILNICLHIKLITGGPCFFFPTSSTYCVLRFTVTSPSPPKFVKKVWFHHAEVRC